MKFLILYTVLVITVTGNPTSVTVGTTAVTPLNRSPIFLIGKHTGEILKCPYETPVDCQLFYKADSDLTSIIVHGEHIYAAIYSGKILQCDLRNKDSCKVFGTISEGLNRVDIDGAHLYVGVSNGTVLKCDFDFRCAVFSNLESGIRSLKIADGYVYAGLSNFQLRRCSLKNNNCTLVFTMSDEVKGLTSMGNTIYAITNNGYLWKCSGNYCESMLSNDTNIIDLASYNGLLYVVKCRTQISVYKWSEPSKRSLYAPHKDISRVAIGYYM